MTKYDNQIRSFLDEQTKPWADDEFFVYRGYKLCYTHNTVSQQTIVHLPGGTQGKPRNVDMKKLTLPHEKYRMPINLRIET